jgi:hypothetical protein
MSKAPPAKKRRAEANKQQLQQLVSLVQHADKLAMFRSPVSTVDFPEYLTIIKYPMDLATISRKIAEGKYATNDDAVSDFKLMLSNALEFNSRGDAWYENTKSVRKRLPDLLKQCKIEVADSSDSDDEFIPQGREDDNEKTLAREEKKRREDIHKTLQKMNDDLNIPVEVLRQRYQQQAIPIAGDGEDFSAGSSGTSTSTSESSSEGTEESVSEEGEEDEEGTGTESS